MTENVRCPICGSKATLRIAKKGPNVGKSFYVCNRYPECEGKAPLEKNLKTHGKTNVVASGPNKSTQKKVGPQSGTGIAKFFWSIAVLLVLFGIGWPAVAGDLGIIMGIGGTTSVPTGNIPLDATQSIGLAVLAAALSGIVTWFGRSNTTDDSRSWRNSDKNAIMRQFGVSYLAAALCFTLFASLSQIIPDIRYRTDLWCMAIKYSAGVFAISGSTLLSFTALWGLVELLERGLIAMWRVFFKKNDLGD